MKSLRLSVLAAALVLGACSAPSPTDPAASTSRASFDGGGMLGGNFTGDTQDGGNMIGSGNFTGETEDGGNTLGSGNGIGTGGDMTTNDGSDGDPTPKGVGTMGSGG